MANLGNAPPANLNRNRKLENRNLELATRCLTEA